jgi:uncharacterized membrane protein YhfC
MGSGSSIFFMTFSAFICLFLPITLALVIVKKYKADLRVFITGAVVFVVSQPLLRIPIITELGYNTWFVLYIQSNLVLYSIFLGLSAGVFEEVGRFIGLRFFMKKRLSWGNGVVFALGHGGAEAILFAGVTYVKMIFQAITGQASSSASSVPPYLFLVGGMERMLAVVIHAGMTMLVLYSVKHKKMRYLLYAILFHALVDSPLPILQHSGLNLNIWILEGYVALFALLALVITIKFKAILDRDSD